MLEPAEKPPKLNLKFKHDTGGLITMRFSPHKLFASNKVKDTLGKRRLQRNQDDP